MAANEKVIFKKRRLITFVMIHGMNITVPVLATAVAAMFTACATSNYTMNKSENLIGTWSCVSATVNGKPLPQDTAALLRLTLTDTRFKTEKGTQVLFDSSYTLDSSKEPKEINMVGTEGDFAGKEASGIYSLEGDTLHLCYTMPGDPRPVEFQSASGSKAYLIAWKRLR
jgi:uncharacterized protein (TIGR03067 family)